MIIERQGITWEGDDWPYPALNLWSADLPDATATIDHCHEPDEIREPGWWLVVDSQDEQGRHVSLCVQLPIQHRHPEPHEVIGEAMRVLHDHGIHPGGGQS